MKLTNIFFALVMLALTQTASAQWGRHPGHGPGHGGPGWGGGLSYQYAGQAPGPIHGSPYGYNYCGTENPGACSYYGQTCYINSGYWWDNSRGENWFNVYRCQ